MRLVEISHDPCRFTARLPNLDEPVRRIFSLRWLIEAIRTRQMALMPPHSWDDPREDPAALCMMCGFPNVPARAGRQQPLSAYLAPAWAQCWSLNPGSDTLLRAYSRFRRNPDTQRNELREEEGVTVTTTVRRLLSAAEAWHREGADGHVVVGRVEYLEDQEIGQRIVNACNGASGPDFFRTVQGRADSLLWKRRYFEHEQEVRLLLIGRDLPDATRPAIRTVAIDPTALFTSISFDPRLPTGESLEREAELRQAGYRGEFVPDTSYQGILWQLLMRRDWPDP